MIIVVADDFSGAAEMGGIAWRFGLSSEVQLDLNLESRADVIVLNTDSRSLDLPEAVAKTQEVAQRLKRSHYPFTLFKKVDSVMRGHIAAEIRVFLDELGYDRALLLPANPGRQRVIRHGLYFIGKQTLEQTIFSEDPDFPISSPDMKILISAVNSGLSHKHIQPKDPLPRASILTGDITAKADIERYISQSSEKDLCSGAAEAFEVFLEHLGFQEQPKGHTTTDSARRNYILIINGSTVKNEDEIGLLKASSIPRVALPGKWRGDYFELDQQQTSAWYQEVFEALETYHIASVSIELPVRRVRGISEIFSSHFSGLVGFISSRIKTEDIMIGLTGGATASSVIRNMGINSLEVVREIEAGVATLSRDDKLFNVKPGSYRWPESFLTRT